MGSSSIVITIGKGGEVLPDNTYGFEVEFCTHDSSVFSFTHVTAAEISIVFPDVDDPFVWEVETDSDHVLEVSTDAVRFATPAIAYEAKDMLVKLLKESVSPVAVPSDVINAVTFAQWKEYLQERLKPLVAQWYSKQSKLAPTITIGNRTWEQVNKDLTPENVDDGINVKAARLRLQINRDAAWNPYVNQTVMSWSEKDWGEGYSSQVNMPMTLQGYFLYVTRWKTYYADKRYDALVAGTVPEEDVDKNFRQKIENWFWMRIIATTTSLFIRAILQSQTFNVLTFDVGETTMDDLKRIAFVYVAVHKILTGAMGSLSEENQLAIQRIAWDQQSTKAMEESKGKNYEELLNEYQVDEIRDWRFWLPYHSHLKSLTALWFKGALQDVSNKEVLGQTIYRTLEAALKKDVKDEAEIWATAFQMELEKLDKLDRKYRERAEAFTNPVLLAELLKRIIKVQKALAKALPGFAVDAGGGGWRLPPPDKRKFLHYAEGPRWEGRYDTMWDATKRDDVGWTYLVEHRFH